MQKSWIKYALHKSDEAKPTEGINLGTNENYNTATEELGVQSLDESIIIESGTLKGRSEASTDDGESVTYNVYLWMDETTGNEAMNTRFEGSINVISSATTVTTAADYILAKVSDSIKETLYLMSIPGMTETILEGMRTPVSELIPEEKVEW